MGIMRLNDESQLLDIAFRKYIIEEIEGEENQERKRIAKRRFDLAKDYTKKYVLEMIRDEQGDQVVKEIIHRTANISIARKIVEKKAKVYNEGIERYTENEEDQNDLDTLTNLANMNVKMKKTNFNAELYKNSIVQVLPYENKVTGKYGVKFFPIAPFLIDVIEDQEDPEQARVYIFSYYNPNTQRSTDDQNHGEGYRHTDNSNSFRGGDGTNQLIADSPDDQAAGGMEYVFWSSEYHFTVNAGGEIIQDKSPENLENPIGMIPFVNFSMDQDGFFWAQGGEDIIDGAILINVLLTDLYYIAKFQGMGVFYMFGNGVPKTIKVGPAEVLTLNMEPGDPVPQIGFASSNPPLQDHMEYIEQYVAMLLSTNNLEPGTINGKLSANNAQSGIQEMVRKSDSTSDVKDQQQIYIDGEKQLLKLLFKWQNYYANLNLLDEGFDEVGLVDEDMPITIKFVEPTPFLTEKERLEIIEKRKELGLDSMLDAIRRDNPDLSEEEAKEKLLNNLKERVEESNQRMMRVTNGQENNLLDQDATESREEERDEERDR